MPKPRTKEKPTVKTKQAASGELSADLLPQVLAKQSATIQTKSPDSKEIARNKKRAKLLKIIGGIIIFLSFITQNYFYDKWNAESQGLHSATVEQAIIDKGALLDEVLYFTSELGKDVLREEDIKSAKEQYIRRAAVRSVLSHSMAVLSTDLGKQEQVEVINKLMRQANAVKDIYSFSELNKSINTLNEEVVQKRRQERIQKIKDKRDTARHTYLVLYLIGSTLLILGIRYE